MRPRAARGGRRQARNPLAQLREDLGEVRRAGPELRPQDVCRRLVDVGPERLHPRPVGGRAPRLPAASHEDPRASLSGAGDQLLGQAGLADPGLADKQEQAATAGECIVQSGDELGQLGLAADERAARARCRGPRRRLLAGRCEPKSGILVEYPPLELAQPAPGSSPRSSTALGARLGRPAARPPGGPSGIGQA